MLGCLGVDVERERFLEGGWVGDDSVFGALALGDADAAGVEVDVGERDADEF